MLPCHDGAKVTTDSLIERQSCADDHFDARWRRRSIERIVGGWGHHVAYRFTREAPFYQGVAFLMVLSVTTVLEQDLFFSRQNRDGAPKVPDTHIR